MNEAVNPREVIGGNEPPLSEQLKLSEEALAARVEALAERANKLPRKLVDATADSDIAEIGAVVRDASALSREVEKRRVAVKQPYLEAGQTVDEFFKAMSGRMDRVAKAFTDLVAKYREEKRLAEAKAKVEAERQRFEAERAAAAERERLARAEEERLRKEAEDAAARGRAATAKLAQERAQAASAAAAEANAALEVASVAKPPEVAPAPLVATKTEVAPDLTLGATLEWAHEITDLAHLDLEVLRPYLKPDHVEAALKMAVRQGVRTCAGAKIYQREKVSFR